MSEGLLEFWRGHGGSDPFDVLFLHAPVMMHSIDAQGRLVQVSRFWADALGYAPEDMVGRKSTDFLTDASRAHANGVVLPAFLKTGRCQNVDYDFVRSDGSILPVLLSATAELDADGHFKRSLAVIFDNTEAKKVRQALEQKAREAQEANAAKSRFLASMSHEIRTPMNAVLGFAHLLQRGDLSTANRKKVDAIISAGKSLMELLTDLLDLSRIESGHMQIDEKPFDLSELLDDIQLAWQSVAADKGLVLRTYADPSVPTRVISDSGRIHQILNNYLSNAIKFTDTGRVSLSVFAEPGLSTEAATLRFDVSDTGRGLTEEQTARLFRPFVQAVGGFAKQQGGWGLGLSICSQFAKLLGGSVGVESVVGQGSTFHLELPVRLEAAPSLSLMEPEDAAELNRLRVLVAEDNPLNQLLLTQMLASIGHQAVVVDDGLSAVKHVAEAPVDLVLMDITMPGMDGVEATERIRAMDGDRRSTPIIAVTANAGPDAKSEYLELGMDDYVPKPIDLDVLSEVIDRVRSGR